MKDLSVVFMGTPEFAVPVLDMLIRETNVKLVVCQPDKFVGRKKEIVFSPIKKLALDNNIEVFQPNKLRDDYQKIIDINPDIIITCAYGQIVPKILLDYPRLKCVNVHASLLPKLRGGAPLNRAIIDGYDKTGVTIMYMDETLDTGDMIAKYEYDILDTDTYKSLVEKLSVQGSLLLKSTLPEIINGTNDREKQDDSLSTYASIIKREEEHIDFNNNCINVDRLVRGLNDSSYANTIINDLEYKIIKGHYELGNSIPNKINIIDKNSLGIGCLDGIYYIDEIKPSGKNIMDIKSFLNGIDKEKFKNYIIK